MDETNVIGAEGRAASPARIERLHLPTGEVLELPHITSSRALTTELPRRVEELERRLADLAAPATDVERAMAHAVLRGDLVAALALADRVREDHAGG